MPVIRDNTGGSGTAAGGGAGNAGKEAQFKAQTRASAEANARNVRKREADRQRKAAAAAAAARNQRRGAVVGGQGAAAGQGHVVVPGQAGAVSGNQLNAAGGAGPGAGGAGQAVAVGANAALQISGPQAAAAAAIVNAIVVAPKSLGGTITIKDKPAPNARFAIRRDTKDGEALTQAKLQTANASTQNTWEAPTWLTDANGQYRFDKMPEGNYFIEVFEPGAAVAPNTACRAIFLNGIDDHGAPSKRLPKDGVICIVAEPTQTKGFSADNWLKEFPTYGGYLAAKGGGSLKDALENQSNSVKEAKGEADPNAAPSMSVGAKAIVYYNSVHKNYDRPKLAFMNWCQVAHPVVLGDEAQTLGTTGGDAKLDLKPGWTWDGSDWEKLLTLDIVEPKEYVFKGKGHTGDEQKVRVLVFPGDKAVAELSLEQKFQWLNELAEWFKSIPFLGSRIEIEVKIGGAIACEVGWKEEDNDPRVFWNIELSGNGSIGLSFAGILSLGEFFGIPRELTDYLADVRLKFGVEGTAALKGAVTSKYWYKGTRTWSGALTLESGIYLVLSISAHLGPPFLCVKAEGSIKPGLKLILETKYEGSILKGEVKGGPDECNFEILVKGRFLFWERNKKWKWELWKSKVTSLKVKQLYPPKEDAA